MRLILKDTSLSEEEITGVIDLALAEDVSHDDITSNSLIPPRLNGKASIIIKEEGIVAGGDLAGKVFHRGDSSLKVEIFIKDGTIVKPGDVVATVSGKVTSILKAERVALNFMQRLSGIASLTSKYVAEIYGYNTTITDTRKTTPGLRNLEKYAVLMGGGKNHRRHLGDGILIKDNHIAALRAMGMNLTDIVTLAKQNSPPGMKVEIEVTTDREALAAAEAGADIVMLDNMSPDEMRRAVELVSGRSEIEASGGITLANVREAAATGVNIISIGALTHSPAALDISFRLES